MTGTVYKSTGSWYTVKTLNGKIYECRIKGKFRIQDIKSTNPIAVGDIVQFEIETKNNKEKCSYYKGCFHCNNMQTIVNIFCFF